MFAAIGVGFDWLTRSKLMIPETERMIVTAIVSPKARPRPSIDPLITADLPKGRTTIRIISQRVAPSARAPSSSLRGVCAKTSRAIAEMIGRIITASTSPAVSMVLPVTDAGPSKRGIQPSLATSQSRIGTIAGPSTKIPQSP